jgi:TolB-like protein
MNPDPARRKNKVRAAWISFIGRIVAQVIGAIASVMLGLMVLTKYGFPDSVASNSAAQSEARPDTVAVSARAPRAPGELALAVLPIQNYSKDAAHAYFADGVTEALITELAQIAGLKVTSRTSSMAYKGTGKPLPTIARELDVDVILEGSMVHDAASVRVTAQLIAADSDQHLWARSYDRPLRQVLPLQTELTTIIAGDVHRALGRWLGAKTPLRVPAVAASPR